MPATTAHARNFAAVTDDTGPKRPAIRCLYGWAPGEYVSACNEKRALAQHLAATRRVVAA